MPSDNPLCLTNANVIDVEHGTILADRAVVIRDGVVEEIAETAPRGGAVTTLDLRGRYVVPGLIDCHCHALLTESDLAAQIVRSPQYVMAKAYGILNGMLMRGFTTIRDCGGADFGLARAVEEGLVAGPRVLYCGKALSQTGGHGDYRSAGTYFDDQSYWAPRISRVADGADALRRAARDEIRKGAHHIKIMAGGGIASPTDRIDSDQYSEEEISAVVEEAAMANLHVSAHTYCSRSVVRAVRCGVRTLEHCTRVDDDALCAIRDAGAFMVPTLIVFKALAEDGRRDGLPAALVEKVGSNLAAGTDAVERARRLGVPMAYGSDLLGTMHPRQLEEFELRAEVVPAPDLLRSATTVGARLLGRERELGQVAPGFRADLLVTDGNPLEDIRVLTQPETRLKAILKDGAIVRNALADA